MPQVRRGPLQRSRQATGGVVPIPDLARNDAASKVRRAFEECSRSQRSLKGDWRPKNLATASIWRPPAPLQD